MLLKNLMEDKQLNFDQPLLSVRRHGPSVTSQKRDNRRIDSYSHQVRHRLPTHVSELKSGPIRDPGAVPFLWEQSPGQPKEEAKPQIRNFDKPPIAPKLPPGRYRKAKQQDYRNVSQDTTGMNQAVNVPCISENKKQEVNVSCNSRTGPSNDESVRNIESSKDIAEEKESSDSEDSDEAYVDALDTLSRAESSFLNCSMSGLSGLEDLDVKPSRSFSKDPQAREFMMDRFIPAAKAMASETPYAPKKQPVQLQIEQPKKTSNECKPSLRYGPSFAKRDDEYDQQANLSSVCGLLPRFCLKSSVCLINPVPAMSVRTRVPTSSANKVRPRSSSSGSYSEMENESRSDKTETKSIDQMQTDELDEDKAKLSSKNGHTTSTNRDATLPFLEHKEVLLVPEENMPVRIEVSGLQNRGLKTFQEFLDDRGRPNESNSGELVVEKTLYVDTVQKVKSPNLRPFSPNTQETEGVPTMLEEEDALRSRRTERMHATDSPHEDLKKFHTADRDEKLLPNAHRFGDCNIIPSIAKSTENRGMEKPQAFGEYQDSNRDSTNKDNLVANVQEAMESLEKQLPRAVTSDNSQQNHFGLPAPPPLPKSPSDSWLWRTLPSMTTKNPSLRPYLGAATNPESHCFKAPASDMKWETIVKTTKVQRRHMHYSEESLTTIPEA
ncbi:hypothetical protein C2S52_012966 [Perilla frutescens var. hirtella]|nr:hypothetical protein C2S52_012966 [Perilla frutescens var. hirtella]